MGMVEKGKVFALFALVAAVGMSGCIQVIQKALEDRTTEDQVTDTKIWGGIKDGLYEKDSGLVLDVTVDVWEHRVLLTGTLDDPAVKEEVVALVKTDGRVREVYDEIQMVSTEEKEKRRQEKKKEAEREKEEPGSFDDLSIKLKIKGQLLAAKGITSVNYRWNSVRGFVYIIGRARSEEEVTKVLGICRNIEGVQDVKQFIEVKPI